MWVYRGFGVLFLLLSLAEGAMALGEGPQGPSTQPDRIAVPNEQASPEIPTEEKSTVTVQAGRLSIRVQNRPLEWVLGEISQQSKVVILNTESVAGQTVSMQLQEMLLDQGLRQILKDHDIFFFYGAEEKGSGEEKEPQATLKAVWIYPKGQGQHIVPVLPEQWASTREMKQGLTDPDPGERARAVELLVERDGEWALNEVLLALRDRNDQVRAQALDAALNSGMQLPAALLEELAQHDPLPIVRFLALGAVADNYGDSFLSNLSIKKVAEFALNDPSPEVKGQARQILEQLEHPPGSTEPEKQQGIEQGQATEVNDSALPTDLGVEGQQVEQEAP